MPAKTARAIKDRIERRTGVIWGRYQAFENFCETAYPQPPFWLMLNSKDSDTVRLDLGFRRRGFYLSWGHR